MSFDQSGQLSYDDFTAWVRRFAGVIAENKQYLTELDAAIGDADHGINMDRGFQAVLLKLDAQPAGDIGAMFKVVGSTLISTVGGASGPLYGSFFLQLGIANAGKSSVGLEQLLVGLDAAISALQRLGKAELGDKTMLDALIPARDALRHATEGGEQPANVLSAAVEAADKGMQATIPLVARKGRASYLGDRSAGHQDPGATSVDLLIRAARDQWAG
jgi:dihydroxyacetone kinase-like protein